MTIAEAYTKLKTDLEKIYESREAANISNLAIENISGFDKSGRLINKNLLLNKNQLAKFSEFSAELLNYTPLQYVLHEAWFSGSKFYVDENVLIPRPETEELVNWIIEDVSLKFPNIKNQDKTKISFSILDVGTGSGCIAVSLKKNLPFIKVFGLDVSYKALQIASENAQSNNVNIEFFQTDILQNPKQSSAFNIIVSNPPYIPENQKKKLLKNVLNFEPELALFVPDQNPLLFYKAISNFSIHHLKENGGLYFEIHEDFENEVLNLLTEKKFNSIQIKKDLQGKSRMIKAIFNA